MDFGDILNEWDKATAKPYGKRKIKDDERRTIVKTPDGPRDPEVTTKPIAHPMDVWLRRHGIEDKDIAADQRGESPAERRRALHALKPEATIDLHGLTRDDAWARLDSFFADCLRRSLRKILIIHGKGTHSDNGSVLLSVVRLYIERHPHAGESGFSERQAGGSGSTWVILK